MQDIQKCLFLLPRSKEKSNCKIRIWHFSTWISFMLHFLFRACIDFVLFSLELVGSKLQFSIFLPSHMSFQEEISRAFLLYCRAWHLSLGCVLQVQSSNVQCSPSCKKSDTENSPKEGPVYITSKRWIAMLWVPRKLQLVNSSRHEW